MLKKIQQIVAVIVTGLLMLSLRLCATPDYEERFERQFLSIDDGLDISEVVVVDLTEHGTQWLKPEKGYYLRLLGGDAPSDLINRFRNYPIPRIRRGIVKHWADEKMRAQIEIKKIVEIDKSSASVYGVIRYPRGFVDDFEYLIKEENTHWTVENRSISNMSFSSTE
jgi:hypothetical protein